MNKKDIVINMYSMTGECCKIFIDIHMYSKKKMETGRIHMDFRMVVTFVERGSGMESEEPCFNYTSKLFS